MVEYYEARKATRGSLGRAADLQVVTPLDPSLARFGENPEVLRRLRLDTAPIPTPEDREGYFAGRDYEYWLSGLRDVDGVLGQLRSAGTSLRWLDFGGASGRVIRHADNDARFDECVVADINVNHIDWVNSNLTKKSRAVKTDIRPPIPVESNYFDIISAFSVFTHIDIQETAWLSELVRLAKPGGLLYLTVHNEDTWDALPGSYVLQNLKRSPAFIADYTAGAPMPRQRLVYDYNDNAAYNTNVFHSNSYIRSTWGRFADVEKILPRAHSYQTVIVMRKRLTG